MLAGYVGSDPDGASWLQALQRRAGAEPSVHVSLLPGGGLLAPQLLRTPVGTVTALVGEPLWCPAGSPGPQGLAGALWRDGPAALCGLDGQWALAQLSPQGSHVHLAHDPFGGYQLYYAEGRCGLWFSTSLDALLAVPEIRRGRNLDLAAVHSYLVFSYVPAPRTLLQNVRCVPPFAAQTFFEPPSGRRRTTTIFALPDCAEPLDDDLAWQAELRAGFLAALQRRVPKERTHVAVALSGGLDSAAVAAGLVHLGHDVTAFHLRFTHAEGEEQRYAEAVSRHLGVPLHTVSATPESLDLEEALRRVVRQTEQPYGDPVTVPLSLLNRTVAAEGHAVCFNGEGGDQLFAGWPNKAMFAAEVYGNGSAGNRYDRVDTYLKTFHHFYGEEDSLYAPALRAAAADTDLRAEIAPYLEEVRLPDLFARLRWTNYGTKGSQNIMPRAAALARAHGLSALAPLFDLHLARFALSVPSPLLLNGTVEKDLFKRAVQDLLPGEIVHRGKRGMGVPATSWVQGPLAGFVRVTLEHGLGRRGLVRSDRLKELLGGWLPPGEIRPRRLGEQLWQLAVLEIWLQTYLDAP